MLRSDVLANYIAFRLMSEQNANWWGVAESFQKSFSNGRNTIQNLLRENIDFKCIK